MHLFDDAIAALGDRTYPFGLQVGAGEGELSARLALRCGRLVTLDPDPAAVQAARRRLELVPNVDARVGRVPADLPTWTFDLIVCDEPFEGMDTFVPRAATVLVLGGSETLRTHPAFVRVLAGDGVERYERR